jgi:hypothetical protein
MRSSLVAALLALSLAAAGCGAPAKSDVVGSFAPQPMVDDATGSVAGLVFDPELNPLAATNVSVDGAPPVLTDESGAFTFNGLAAGTHTLSFSRAGFEALVRKADVTPGEVTQMRVELQPAPLDTIYHWSFSKIGLVRVGQWSLQYVQHLANNSALDAAVCDPCSYPVALKPDISDALTEVQYSRAASVPLVNEYVTIAYSVAQTTGGSLKLLMTHDFSPRHSYQWSGVQVRELRGYENVRLEFHGPDMEPPGLLVNQKVEVWQTFAHGALLPKEYTLLPG